MPSEVRTKGGRRGVISYLRVEESVGVVPVGGSLVQSVVAASRVVHVHVRYAHRESQG